MILLELERTVFFFFFFGVCVCLFVFFLSHPKSLERVQTAIFGAGTLFFESTVLLGGRTGHTKSRRK